MLNWTHCLNDFMNINIHIQLSVFSFSAATGALSAGGCNPRAKRGQEEPPHVRGQGQKTGGPQAQRVAAKRSYPMSEVRGSGRECQAATVQEWPRGATPHPRSGAAAGRSYPTAEVRGGSREELPGVRSQWQWPRVPGCDSTGAAKRSYNFSNYKGKYHAVTSKI